LRAVDESIVLDTYNKQWLEKYGVKYHSLQFGKMKFDVLVDDKSVNPTA